MNKLRVFVVAGLGFGDEGKGSVVDFLSQSKNAKGVVRYNGGPQAAHHVVLPDKRWHCFSQFTSGSFVPDVRCHLAHSMLIKPSNLLVERDLLRAKGLYDIAARTSIDPNAYIVTPWDAMLCKMDEVARGANLHGSVGMGVGKAALDRKCKNPNALKMIDLLKHERLQEKLNALWEQKGSEARKIISLHTNNEELNQIFQHYSEAASPSTMYRSYCEVGELLGSQFISDQEFSSKHLSDEATIVLEGAQGVLLDYARGFFPHVTKTDTTFQSANDFLENAGLLSAQRHNVGILRAYGTRHGAGPFVTEDRSLERSYREEHNGTHRWQGAFRVGHFDLLASRYAVSVSGVPDYIALTHLDSVAKQSRFRVCDAYEYTGNATQSELERYFELDMAGTSWIIRRIRNDKQPSQHFQRRLTELLCACKPHSFIDFAGWGAKQPGDSSELPTPLRHFLNYLESADGLNCPIKILSFGPTAADKIWIA